MNNKEVAHLWANQSRKSAFGSHFYFQGDTIYSYGPHFPIARLVGDVVLFTTRGYSNSTARHKGIALSACHHKPLFFVETPSEQPGRNHIQQYKKRIDQRTLHVGRCRNTDDALASLVSLIDEANRYCVHFGFNTRFADPDNIENLRLRAKQASAKERVAKEREKQKALREAKEMIARWIKGEPVSIPHTVDTVYLRVRREKHYTESTGFSAPVDLLYMETSKGARVPLVDAEKAYRFARLHRAKGWHRNGEVFRVGDYHLDAVNDFGVIAGCHRISWVEIERFATQQGWAAKAKGEA